MNNVLDILFLRQKIGPLLRMVVFIGEFGRVCKTVGS